MKKKTLSKITFLILLLSIFTACSSKSNSLTESLKNADVDRGNVESKYGNEAEGESQMDPEVAETSSDAAAMSITGSGAGEQSAINAVLAERKIIRNANVTVEVEKFDEAFSRINSLLTGIGFIQESNIDTEKIYVDGEQKLLKSGVIVIRVDKDKFDKVFNDVKGLGIATRESMGIEDVTSKYLDVESRLRLLRYEENRLEEYLKKLDDPDKIFKTQSRLTDIRHEIESLTVTLRKLDDLVDLSTITINMNEKRPDETSPSKMTYGDRLLENFLDSLKGVITFCGELIIIVFQIIPVLFIMGFFVFIALIIYRKSLKRSKFIYPNKKDKDEKDN